VRVLIVDDDPTSRLIMEHAVKQVAHEPLLAADGDEAWRLTHQEQPDVLITDRNMPGIDGLELCRRLRAEPERPYTYIVLVTSMADRADVLAGMQAGADDYLTKPIDPFALHTRLIAARRVTELHSQLRASQQDLLRLARTDPLTQLRNRLSLGDDLAAVHARAVRHHTGYSVALCDVDFFKRYNDTRGHQAGDDALRQVATALATHAREADLVYRYGGEEFLLLLPDHDVAAAERAGERVRAAVERLRVPHPHGVNGVVTLSVGVAACPAGHPIDRDTVLKHADDALYHAKQHGRNQVTRHATNTEDDH